MTQYQNESNNKEDSQIERLIEAINRSQQVPAKASGTSASLDAWQQQSLQEQMETLTQNLKELIPVTTKSSHVAGNSEPQKGYQHKLDDLTELMKRVEDQQEIHTYIYLFIFCMVYWVI